MFRHQVVPLHEQNKERSYREMIGGSRERRGETQDRSLEGETLSEEELGGVEGELKTEEGREGALKRHDQVATVANEDSLLQQAEKRVAIVLNKPRGTSLQKVQQ